MALSEFERLFLLEFFVDFVNIQSSSFDNVESSLCVSFQFLNYPVMRVCEEEFTPKPKPLAKDSKIIFKSGKSCLFSVHSDEHKKIPSQFNLVIAVCQKMKCSEGRQLLGEATVNLGHSFMNLLAPPQELSVPVSGVRHDLFPLKDKAGKVVGSIAAFARISCFGKLIVTEFQLAAEDDINYMFKGTDVTNLLQDSQAIPNIDYEKNEEEMLKDTPYEDIFGYPPESEDEQEFEILEKRFEEENSEGVQESPYADSIFKGDEDQIKAEDDKEKSQEEENYKEIGAEVNGHSIVIRVLKKNKKQKKSEDNNSQQIPSCCCPPEPPICPNAPKLNVCSCDYPLVPELIPRCPPQCCPPPCCCCPAQSVSTKRPSNSMQLSKGSFQKANVSVSTCPREDCPLNVTSGLQQLPELEPNTIAVKGDYAFYHGSNKPGEPMKEKEKKIANSLYYKSNPNDSSKTAPQIV